MEVLHHHDGVSSDGDKKEVHDDFGYDSHQRVQRELVGGRSGQGFHGEDV